MAPVGNVVGSRKKNSSSRLLVVAFLLFGGYWGIPAIIGEATLSLIATSVINIITGIVLFVGWRRDITKGLVVSTSSYNLVLSGYQVYASSILIGTGLVLFTILTVIPSLVAAIVAGIIVLVAYTNDEIISPHQDRSLPASAERSIASKG
ncbi:MAG: hypothetical protein V3U49_05285 [Nitrososphaerales archaeon]